MELRDEILSRLTPYDIYGDNLLKSTKGFKMHCPFHSEKTASFHIYADSLSFHCFGCHKGGSAFEFVMQKEKVEFKEALRLLADKAGITLSEGGRKDRYARLYAAGLEAQKFYSEALVSDTKANDYLKSRGLTDKSITKFHLGSTPANSLLPYLREKGFTDEEILAAGLVHKKDGTLMDFFYKRIMFPVITGRRVVGFSGRAIKGIEPKYLNTPATPVFKKGELLYGYDSYAVKEKGFSLLVEGNLDVIMCHQHGFTNACASLGSNLSDEQVIRIGKDTDTVILAFDGDKAGVMASGRAAKLLFEKRMKGSVVVMPEGEDPASFLFKGGDLQQLIDRSLPSPVYLAKHFPSMRKMISNEILNRGRHEISEFLAYIGTTQETDSFREFSARLLIENSLKEVTSVSSKDGMEIKRFGGYLLLFSKGKFLYWEKIKEKSDCKEQAENMLSLILGIRSKGVKSRKK